MTEPEQLYRLSKTPSGRKLWSYMAAILEVTGMDRGRAFPLKKFFSNFKTHLEEGRIVADTGGYCLTKTGKEYFNDRLKPGNPQSVQRAEVEVMIKGLTSGVGEGQWEKLS